MVSAFVNQEAIGAIKDISEAKLDAIRAPSATEPKLVQDETEMSSSETVMATPLQKGTSEMPKPVHAPSELQNQMMLTTKAARDSAIPPEVDSAEKNEVDDSEGILIIEGLREGEHTREPFEDSG